MINEYEYGLKSTHSFKKKNMVWRGQELNKNMFRLEWFVFFLY